MNTMNTPRMHIESYFDPATSTFSHIVWDASTGQCALIDSVLDYDPKSGRTDTASADRLIDRVGELDLSVQWLLETHVHADHLSAAPYLQQRLGGLIAIGSHITTVQNVFGKLFNAGTEFARDGSQFDRLLVDGESFSIGHLQARALHTPGHTPACMTYVVRDHSVDPIRTVAFVGDTLFMPDYGTAQHAVPVHSKGVEPARRHRALPVPRLPAQRPRTPMPDHRGRAESRQCACAPGRADAGADPAFGASQHAGGPNASTRRQWRDLPQDTHQRRLSGLLNPVTQARKRPI